MAYDLYYKGKRLPNHFVDFIKKYSAKKINVDNPKQLHDFWEKNKEKFIKAAHMGLPSIPHGLNKMVEILTELSKRKDLYVDFNGKVFKASLKELINWIVLTEHYVTNTLGGAMFLMKYWETWDGNDVIVRLPDIKRLQKIQEKFEEK